MRNFQKLIIYSVLLSLATQVYSQAVAVENQWGDLYPEMYNYFKIIAEGIPCKDIYVTSDNGEVEKNSNCEYTIRPHKLGAVHFYIQQIKDKDTILLTEKIYRVLPIPVKMLVGRKGSGNFSITEFKLQDGVIAMIQGLDFNARVKVNRFNMQIIRNCMQMAEIENTGGRFGEEAKDQISQIQAGDKVLFDKIFLDMPGTDIPYEVDSFSLDITQ